MAEVWIAHISGGSNAGVVGCHCILHHSTLNEQRRSVCLTRLRVFRAVFSALENNIVKIESCTALRNVYKQRPKHARGRCRSTDRLNMELTHLRRVCHNSCLARMCTAQRCVNLHTKRRSASNHGASDKILTAVELFWWMLLTTFRCPYLGQTNLLVAVEFHYLTCQRDWTHHTHLKDSTNRWIYKMVIFIFY